MKNITQSLKVIVLALSLSFGLSYAYAWTAPTVSPPGGNVSAPINTSTTDQIKGTGTSGGLGVSGLIRGYSNLVIDGTIQTGAFNLPTGAGDGKVLTSDASGNASWR